MFDKFNYSVSIIIPTYNRKKFEKLIEYNINIQDYNNIKEIIIIDDGDDEPLCINTKYPIHYVRVERCSIGFKRSYGVNLAKSAYICHIDTDDFYNPKYISSSIFNLICNDKEISGSADMLVYGDGKYYKQRCCFIHMLNEATMIYKKRNNINYNNTNSNEAVPFLIQNIDKIHETNIVDIMCCLSHSENTIDKKQWINENYLVNIFDEEIYKKHLEILSLIKL
jgi:glycosyltransferase involved in cell wall biosynthesis